jgi:hypothetical protein
MVNYSLLYKKYSFQFLALSKFHHSLLIKGWCNNLRTKFLGHKIKFKNISCRLVDHKGLTWTQDDVNVGDATSFLIQILLPENKFPDDLLIDFEFIDGGTHTVSLSDIQKKLDGYKKEISKIDDMFWNMVNKSSVKRVLDIGGRARSGIDRSKDFTGKEVVVLDIINDANVDIICDAHVMSKKLPPESFDAVYCIAVFEHLIMPWKVALEMNKVMKTGAIGLVHTHQTIGMHDMPWDYYRYSDTAWKGIFNKHTGFEILATELKDTQFIIPLYYKERYKDVEKNAGYESSTVLVKKISNTKLEWPLSAHDVTGDMYPDIPDGNVV